jgi:hypothetical protein
LDVGVAVSIVGVYLFFYLEKRFQMSEYDTLKKRGLVRGRPRLSEEEKKSRKEMTGKRQEARRRALLVLQHRYADEYAKIFEEELKAVLKK